MILLAVSGGPDSMYLLYKYRNKNVVVAHVNYHLRDFSNQDTEIVKAFCNQHNINLEILDVKTKPQNNTQTWARKIRYDFFVKIAKKYHINKLVTAHHKDDFLETALMQQQSQRNPRYFGMQVKKQLYGLQVIRPLLHKVNKAEILRFLHEHQISYAIDETNFNPIYYRNKIRQQLEKTLPSEKKDYYQWFMMSNKILTKKFKKVDALYNKWKKTKFDTLFFKMQRNFKPELVFELVHQNFHNINLSTNKINGLIDFIEGKDNNKMFKLSSTQTIIKTKHYLFFS